MYSNRCELFDPSASVSFGGCGLSAGRAPLHPATSDAIKTATVERPSSVAIIGVSFQELVSKPTTSVRLAATSLCPYSEYTVKEMSYQRIERSKRNQIHSSCAPSSRIKCMNDDAAPRLSPDGGDCAC